MHSLIQEDEHVPWDKIGGLIDFLNSWDDHKDEAVLMDCKGYRKVIVFASRRLPNYMATERVEGVSGIYLTSDLDSDEAFFCPSCDDQTCGPEEVCVLLKQYWDETHV